VPSGRADSPIRIRPALPGDLANLSLLCLRSKAVWGYSAGFIAACRPFLELRPDDLVRSHVAMAERRGHAIGVAQVTAGGRSARLDKIYVEPRALRRGAGAALFVDAVRAARAAGAHDLVIDSDPGAAGFFLRMGAHPAGEAPSPAIPGRLLPRFVLPL
jgi:GNAT superfamily N-acetyltransferase